ncbi:MAG: glycine cleavage system aminomethyltransferase GcvT [Anaerolineales bacterium]
MQISAISSADLEEIDPFVADLIALEAGQQIRKLILIPSVSAAPNPVLQALGSVFQNVCAEGLPSARMLRGSEEDLQNVAWQMATNRRYADRRFYKGVNYVDFIESLAQQRCAELFANGNLKPEHLHINVQSLSGGTANLAVYRSLMEAGDVLMGMNLYEGGHLSHGSRFNVSGQRYQVVSYAVDPKTERLDYERIRGLALKHRPRVIIAGYTSYPWAPDWKAFRAIADEVGAYLMADIAHTAGLVIAGVVPNPVGIADVTTLTTNKTLCGPRAAVTITTDKQLAQEIDQAVFPGMQGAPHPNKFAAVAVAFRIAGSKAFHDLQRQIAANAKALASGLQARGIRLAYGGTDTHLMTIDLKALPSTTGHTLYGEPAARILELTGLIVNRNSIPGDDVTATATGLRLGTPWISQRGLDEGDMETLAGLISRVLLNIHPFVYHTNSTILPRGKIALDVLEEVRQGVDALVEKAEGKAIHPGAAFNGSSNPARMGLRITGWRARQFVQQVATSNLAHLATGESKRTFMLDRHGKLIDQVIVHREKPSETGQAGQDRYLVIPTPENAENVASWLWGLSDGYVLFDDEDVFRKVEGPVVVEMVPVPDTLTGIPQMRLIRQDTGDKNGSASAPDLFAAHPEAFDLDKPYFVGQSYLVKHTPPSNKNPWRCQAGDASLKRTPLYEIHKAMGAKMVPFAGWEMPVRYGSVIEEHRAVREAAGFFDVAHMGVFEIEGPHATTFLDVVFSNYVAWLDDDEACYGYLLDPEGNVIDDAIVYRRQANRYWMVVNAANEDRDWDWLNQINAGRVIIDRNRPWVQIEAPVTLRNLKDPASGERGKRDLALQGPASLPTLQAMTADPDLKFALTQLKRNGLLSCELAGIEVVLARTGYTGEEWGFEIFVHPDEAAAFWNAALEAGKPFGVKPVGLAARDSTRTEAGLPLWGLELAGPYNISPIEAGFPSFVKYHKPFFIGRDALIAKENSRSRELIRFRANQKGVRRPRLGDPVVTAKGQITGRVTSCAADGDRNLIGLAIIKRQHTLPNTPLAIFPLGGKSIEEGLLGKNKVTLPIHVTVLTRFPENE